MKSYWFGFRDWFKARNAEMELQSLAIGMNSTVDITSDLHIVMLDYDTKELAKIQESIKELQQFWKLSDAEIFETKHGYHVFFWYDIVPYDRLKMIINFAMYVDPMYKYISRYYDHKTIRAYGKHNNDIKFVKMMKGNQRVSPWQIDIGSMKREEHRLLRQ